MSAPRRVAQSLPESDNSATGAGLVDELVELLEKHVVLPDGAAVAVALWIMHTHGHSAAQISPLLILSSPIKRCGKSTAMRLLSALVCNPVLASNITPAALFRYVDQEQPTLLLDEADTFMRGNDEMRGIINCGHTRTDAYVIRCVGNTHRPVRFNTWCPKAIALIGKLHPAIMDRGIVIPMRRKRPDEEVCRLRSDRLREFLPINDKCAAWVKANIGRISKLDPDLPNTLGDRAADNWRPLLAIADVADYRVRALEAIRCLTYHFDDDEELSELLLADLLRIFDRTGKQRLASRQITISLNNMEDRPWPNFGNGRGMGPRHIANILRAFQIRPETLRLESDGPAKGYRRDAFLDAWTRYLPGIAVLPLQINVAESSQRMSSVTEPACVTDNSGVNRLRRKDCYGVTDTSGKPIQCVLEF